MPQLQRGINAAQDLWELLLLLVLPVGHGILLYCHRHKQGRQSEKLLVHQKLHVA